mgnify:CR=1 FL=1
MTTPALHAAIDERRKQAEAIVAGFRAKVQPDQHWSSVASAQDVTRVKQLHGDVQVLQAEIDRRAEHEETPYGPFTLYSIGRDGYGAFINDNLIVFSEGRAALEKTLDTADGKAKTFAATALSASLKEVPAGAFLKGVLPDLSGLGKEIGRSKVLDKASGLFFLAQEKSESLLVRLQVTAGSPESAKDMADVVQGLIAMARLSESRDKTAKLGALLEGLKVNLDGKVLRLDFERPSQVIAALLSERHGMHRLFN